MNYSTRRFRNFGIRASSRVESLHNELKVLMRNRMADLLKLFKVIRTSVETQLTVQRRSHRHQNQLLDDLRWKVCFKALDLADQQRLYAEDMLAGRRTNTDCTGSFILQWGISCCHMMQDIIWQPRKLRLEDIHIQWHLHPDTALIRQRMEHKPEPEPDVITRKGKKPPTSKPGRILSAWEVAEMDAMPRSRKRAPASDTTKAKPKKKSKKNLEEDLQRLIKENELLRHQNSQWTQTQPSMPPAIPPASLPSFAYPNHHQQHHDPRFASSNGYPSGS